MKSVGAASLWFPCAEYRKGAYSDILFEHLCSEVFQGDPGEIVRYVISFCTIVSGAAQVGGASLCFLHDLI